MTHLGNYFRCECKCRLLTLGQVARMIGYRNANNGIRKLLVFENTGIIKTDLLVKLAEALGWDWHVVEELAEEDRQERLRAWEAWANEPVPMRLVVRVTAACYCQRSLPPEITTQQQAERWACEFAAKHRVQTCLIVNRRLSVWIDQYGYVTARTKAKPGEPNQPSMQVGQHTFLLDDEGCGKTKA